MYFPIALSLHKDCEPTNSIDYVIRKNYNHAMYASTYMYPTRTKNTIVSGQNVIPMELIVLLSFGCKKK